jgi:hypothetical protein
MRQIEICVNNEWLELDEVTSNAWFDLVANRIESAFSDVECVGAKGQRCFFHGWNGCNTFSRKSNGVGTFDNFTDSEWGVIDEIAGEAMVSFSDED